MQLRKEIVVPIAIGVTTFISGLGAGYALGKTRNKRPYFEGGEATSGDTSPEVADTPTAGGIAEGAREAVGPSEEQAELPFGRAQEPSGESLIIVEETETEIIIHTGPTSEIGDYSDDDWDYEVEKEKRDPRRPYIIHVDEFSANEMDYPQETCMYYAGDDVVCDKTDAPVYNRAKIFGPLLFGHGSQDPNIVYIRNEVIECEYEVLRNPGHFNDEILGLEQEIQHDGNGRKRKGKQHPKFKLE